LLKRPSNSKLLIENTVGTGLPTILAMNLGLIPKVDMPEKDEIENIDISSLQLVNKMFNNEKIYVDAKHDGRIELTTKTGTIMLE